MTTLGNMRSHWRFVKAKPSVLPRIANGIFRSIVLRQRRLRTVDWAVTYNCNAKCVMCSARKLYDPNREELTLDQREDVWKQALKLGAIHTQFTGGEPLTKGIDWVCDAIKRLTPEKTLISMSSNTSLLTKESIKRMHNAGLDILQLSLDSMIPETHNRLRGLTDNFEHIIKMSRYARDIGMNVNIGCVIAKNNLDEIYKLVEFTKDEGFGLSACKISNPENWETDDYVSWSTEDYNLYKAVMDIPHVRTDTFFNFRGSSGCPASGERIEITAYGDVLSCPQVQISFGNVLEEPLKDIWKRVWQSPLFHNHCAECRWAWDKKFYDIYLKPYENEPKPIPYQRILDDLKSNGVEPYSPNFKNIKELAKNE